MASDLGALPHRYRTTTVAAKRAHKLSGLLALMGNTGLPFGGF